MIYIVMIRIFSPRTNIYFLLNLVTSSAPPSPPSRIEEMGEDLKGKKLVAVVLKRLSKLRIDHSDYGSCITDCYRLFKVVASIGKKEMLFLSKKVNFLRVVCDRFRIASRRYFSVNGHELDILLELMAMFLPLST